MIDAGVDVSRCDACGWQGFPQRLWCPSCGAEGPTCARVTGGVLEEATVLRRALATELPNPVQLGVILLDGGGRLIARLVDAGPGERVRLRSDDGVPVASHHRGRGAIPLE